MARKCCPTTAENSVLLSSTEREQFCSFLLSAGDANEAFKFRKKARLEVAHTKVLSDRLERVLNVHLHTHWQIHVHTV